MADNDLFSLIRVRTHTVEQKQKVLADLYQKADELKNEREQSLEKLEREKIKAQEMDVSMLSYLGAYGDAVQERVEEIKEQELHLEKRIEIAQEDMRQAFAELKKVEITQENRKAEERAELDKKEMDGLDEIAIETYRRNLEEG
ncbi:MAG: hypothetical protein CMH26_01365 [Micavibrio sp.]|nr:hypothetical protein [Micavibrio sp.]|tara:strand:+ start:1127 stop:1558 length:432 start_codon:yes stop_codon:yes gene_type:complete